MEKASGVLIGLVSYLLSELASEEDSDSELESFFLVGFAGAVAGDTTFLVSGTVGSGFAEDATAFAGAVAGDTTFLVSGTVGSGFAAGFAADLTAGFVAGFVAGFLASEEAEEELADEDPELELSDSLPELELAEEASDEDSFFSPFLTAGEAVVPDAGFAAGLEVAVFTGAISTSLPDDFLFLLYWMTINATTTMATNTMGTTIAAASCPDVRPDPLACAGLPVLEVKIEVV